MAVVDDSGVLTRVGSVRIGVLAKRAHSVVAGSGSRG